MSSKKFRIGLVLSGGGTKGFAHLGVIKALNESGIYPDVISGTSAGAIAGVMYADGYTPKEILKIMNTSSKLYFVRPTVPRDGLLRISGMVRILQNNLRAKTFEELKIPLYVTATDLNNGKAVYFSEGDLLCPVIASASIPVLFKPLLINNIPYVDGGVLDNLPIAPLEHRCKYIIGSYINPVGKEEGFTNLINIAERTFLLSVSRGIREKAEKFDLYISPPELKNYKVLGMEKAEEVFMIGYNATIEKLKDLNVKMLIQKRLSDDHKASDK